MAILGGSRKRLTENDVPYHCEKIASNPQIAAYGRAVCRLGLLPLCKTRRTGRRGTPTLFPPFSAVLKSLQLHLKS
jgi:hypothetical protein